MTDATFTFGGPFIAVADALFSEWMGEDSLNFQYYPAGVGAVFGTGEAGKPIYEGIMFLTEYSIDSNVGDKITVSSASQIIGVPTRDPA